MHDTVIRGGTIIDGTGKPGYTGDVALQDGKIAEVGGKAGPGKREIDANGLLVQWLADDENAQQLSIVVPET